VCIARHSKLRRRVPFVTLAAVHFGFWDIALIVVVSTQATVLAYLRRPRLKALAYTLPFPFTLATLSLGRSIDATNVAGMSVIVLYIHAVRWLYRGARLPIVLAIGLSALGYTGLSWLLAPLLPSSDAAFWTLLSLTLALALALYLGLPHRPEPGHRTTLPVYIKAPIIAAVIVGLVAIKSTLQGFMTLFPMVGVVAAYEARHCLWTVGRQMPAWMLAMLPMMAVMRVAQPAVGIPASLGLGWLVFLAILVPLTLLSWRREERADEPPSRRTQNGRTQGSPLRNARDA